MKKQSPLKEKPLRQAGQSGREMLQDYISNELFVIIFIPCIFGLVAFFQWAELWWGNPNPIFLTLCFVASVIYSIHRLKCEVKKEVFWKQQGIDGEVTVAQELEGLRAQGFLPFHDLPSVAKDGHPTNIDHILVGKKGIFTIETKTLSKYPGDHLRYENGSFWLSGSRVDHAFTQSLAESHWLRGELKKKIGKDFFVQATLLFPGQFVEVGATTQAKFQGVLLLSSKALGSFLENYHDHDVLSEEEINSITSVLKEINRK